MLYYLLYNFFRIFFLEQLPRQFSAHKCALFYRAPSFAALLIRIELHSKKCSTSFLRDRKVILRFGRGR